MLRFAAALLAVLLVAFVGLGYVLPTDWEAKRQATFETTPDRVAAVVGQLDTWPEWSHLSTHVDEKTKVDVSGATLSWGGGDELGEGALADFSTEDGCTTYALVSGDLKSSGSICWTAEANDDPEAPPKTTVVWSETGAADGGPLVRWFSFLSVDAILGARFEDALGRLEELAEAEVEAAAPSGDGDDSGDDDDSAGDDDDSAGDDDDSGPDDTPR